MSDDVSARLGLPYLAAGQMQKHVTLNEALTRLDAVVQTAAVSRTTAEEPAGPNDGTLYILPADAIGESWSGMDEGTLARAEAGGWAAVEAVDGLVVLIRDTGELVVRHDGQWVSLGARLGAVQDLARIGLGATADDSNPFLAKVNQALWTALDAGSGGTGDLRLILNKEAAGDVLSLLLQSGYGGRAELGLIGDDDLRLKVSADGSGWNDALFVERSTGRAWFPCGAVRRETTILTGSGDYEVPAWARVIEAVAVGGGGAGGAGASGVSGPRFGGGGGGAGGLSEACWPADQISTGLTVTVGVGGSASGQAGGDTTVNCGTSLLLTGQGGRGGAVGDATSGLGGAGGAGSPESNRGGQSVLASVGEAGRGFDRPDGAGGGGAGGALDAANTARPGGEGGRGGALTSPAWPGAGGVSGVGGDGQNAGWPQIGWAGAGGGGGGANGAGAGHAGGAGGTAGAGGGGGGAGTTAGGTGGDGAAGVVWLTAVG